MNTLKINKQWTVSLALLLAALAGEVFSQTVIYKEDFSGLTPPTPAPWRGPSWNSGDFATTTAGPDGPEGAIALTRSYEVIGGRWYGGGIAGPWAPMLVSVPADTDPAAVSISFWLKSAASNAIRGSVGFSILSSAVDVGNPISGAAYKLIPIAPANWTKYTYKLSEMEVGIPNGASGQFQVQDGYIQVFVWLRNDYEAGWPTEEGVGITWSVSLAGIEVSAEVDQPPVHESPWKDLPVENGLKLTEQLGWIYDGAYPWVYSFDFAGAAPETPGAGWLYVYPEGFSFASMFLYSPWKDNWLWTGTGFTGWYYLFGPGGGWQQIPAPAL